MGRFSVKASELFFGGVKYQAPEGASGEQVDLATMHWAVEHPEQASASQLEAALSLCAQAHAQGLLNSNEACRAVPRMALECAGKGGDLGRVLGVVFTWRPTTMVEWVGSMDEQALMALVAAGRAPWGQRAFASQIEGGAPWKAWGELSDPFERAGAAAIESQYAGSTLGMEMAWTSLSKHLRFNERDGLATARGAKKALERLEFQALPPGELSSSTPWAAEISKRPKAVAKKLTQLLGKEDGPRAAARLARLSERTIGAMNRRAGWLEAADALMSQDDVAGLKGLREALGDDWKSTMSSRWRLSGSFGLASPLINAALLGAWGCLEFLATSGAEQAWEHRGPVGRCALSIAQANAAREPAGSQGACQANAALAAMESALREELAGAPWPHFSSHPLSFQELRRALELRDAARGQGRAKAAVALAKHDLPEGLASLRESWGMDGAQFWGGVWQGKNGAPQWLLAQAARAGAWKVVSWAASQESALTGLEPHDWAWGANPLAACRWAMEKGAAEGREREAQDAIAALGLAVVKELSSRDWSLDAALDQTREWAGGGPKVSKPESVSKRDSASLWMDAALAQALAERAPRATPSKAARL
jgi:hypothetical protein